MITNLVALVTALGASPFLLLHRSLLAQLAEMRQSTQENNERLAHSFKRYVRQPRNWAVQARWFARQAHRTVVRRSKEFRITLPAGVEGVHIGRRWSAR